MVFIADGRFHIEVVNLMRFQWQSAMIINPSVRTLRYNPYSVNSMLYANQQHGTHGGGVRPDQDEGYPILAD